MGIGGNEVNGQLEHLSSQVPWHGREQRSSDNFRIDTGYNRHDSKHNSTFMSTKQISGCPDF